MAPGVRLLDGEQGNELWRDVKPGNAMPMFSPDGKLVSMVYAESRDRDAIWVYDVASGAGRVADRAAAATRRRRPRRRRPQRLRRRRRRRPSRPTGRAPARGSCCATKAVCFSSAGRRPDYGVGCGRFRNRVSPSRNPVAACSGVRSSVCAAAFTLTMSSRTFDCACSPCFAKCAA